MVALSCPDLLKMVGHWAVCLSFIFGLCGAQVIIFTLVRDREAEVVTVTGSMFSQLPVRKTKKIHKKLILKKPKP